MPQDARLLRMKAGFLDDSCVVTYLNGAETLSQPFQFQVGFQSTEETLLSEDVIGQKASVAIHPQGSSEAHYIHGRVNQLTLLDVTDNGTRSYEVSLVPGFWFLSQAGTNRIFENKTAMEIVEEVIKAYGAYCPFEIKANKQYLVREYCVQFNESDLAFVQRLLSEDGISYYFIHAETDHTLVFADAPGSFTDAPEGKVVIEGNARDVGSEGVAIYDWRRTVRYHPTACEQIDYNQDTPKNFYKQHIPTTSKFSQPPSVNCVQHYGGYNFKTGSNSCHDFEPDYNKLLTANWMEAMESGHNVAEGGSNCTGFRTGARFELEHALASECEKYLLTRVSHQANNSMGGMERYQNRFQCMVSSVPVRPPRDQIKRHMPGPQMAKVMALCSSASQNDADPQKMVQVQFPWDSEHNSCKLRVLQGYAGSGWGASFVPREGQEVLVDFINGDPDRPIVVGAMYNKDNQGPKYTSTQSGWLTQSGDANEFRFDDKGGAEEIYMKAGKDYNFVVANNETGAVHNDQSLAVSNMRSVDVGANETKTIGANQTLSVGQNQSNSIGSNKTETIAINFAETVGAAKELTIGGAYQVTVGAAMNETVAAAKAEEVGASRFLVVGQSMSEDVGKDRSLNVGNTSSHTAKKILISAEDELTIKVGKASLTMKKDGTITLSGKDIDLKGTGKINVKASKDVVIKGSKVLNN